MSEDFLEPTSDSFWEIGQYKRTVKRSEDGYKLCNDLMQMISDRADIEKAYAKSLKSWSKKWNDYLHKGSEYGSMKATWTSALNESDKLAEIHQTTHNVLIEELNNDIKVWQKANYVKSIVNQLKMAKEYEEEFKKAQKPWSKKYLLAEKTKKDYHSSCKSYQSAKVQHNNSLADSTISPDQKKKLEDKVEKHKKEVEITKNKYKQALDDLNSYNSRYIEDMTTVYKKCDQFEKERLDFFIEKFHKLHNYINIYERTNVSDIYSELNGTIKQSNPSNDLQNWSRENGANMAMNWPVFEEYSEELKTIAKGSRATKLGKDHTENNGVTMTSIKHKNEDVTQNDVSNIDARSISNAGNESQNSFRDSRSGKAERLDKMNQNNTSPKLRKTNNYESAAKIQRKESIKSTEKSPLSEKVSYPDDQNPFADEFQEEKVEEKTPNKVSDNIDQFRERRPISKIITKSPTQTIEEIKPEISIPEPTKIPEIETEYVKPSYHTENDLNEATKAVVSYYDNENNLINQYNLAKNEQTEKLGFILDIETNSNVLTNLIDMKFIDDSFELIDESDIALAKAQQQNLQIAESLNYLAETYKNDQNSNDFDRFFSEPSVPYYEPANRIEFNKLNNDSVKKSGSKADKYEINVHLQFCIFLKKMRMEKSFDTKG